MTDLGRRRQRRLQRGSSSQRSSKYKAPLYNFLVQHRRCGTKKNSIDQLGRRRQRRMQRSLSSQRSSKYKAPLYNLLVQHRRCGTKKNFIDQFREEAATSPAKRFELSKKFKIQGASLQPPCPTPEMWHKEKLNRPI